MQRNGCSDSRVGRRRCRMDAQAGRRGVSSERRVSLRADCNVIRVNAQRSVAVGLCDDMTAEDAVLSQVTRIKDRGAAMDDEAV